MSAPLGVTTMHDQLALELLRADREATGEGVTRTELATAAVTRWPDDVIRRLRRNGYVIDEQGDRFRLFDEPAAEEER